MTQNSEMACKAYQQLEDRFKANIALDMKRLLWGLILVPLSRERKIVADHVSYLKDYLEHVAEVPLPIMDKQNLLLSKYSLTDGKSNEDRSGKLLFIDYSKKPYKLDYQTFPKSIKTLLGHKPFFKRFVSLRTPQNQALFNKVLSNAEVELYRSDQPIFLRDRIGVITMGSIEVRCHDGPDILKPYFTRKAIEGDVIGFEQGDDGVTSSPLTWLICKQDMTEVIYFSKEHWDLLWGL